MVVHERGNMYKKLDDEVLNNILESGIDEFVDKGLGGANMRSIARRAGVSVGVIYKYYSDKDSFFRACLAHSLELLDSVLAEAVNEDDDIDLCIRKIVYALVRNSEQHSNYNAMYNEITSGGCRAYAAEFAGEIEARSAKVYRYLIAKAQEQGKISKDADSGALAFFFDNLLMMLQFSLSCGYYRERMKIFCGEDTDKNDIAEYMISFIQKALIKEA